MLFQNAATRSLLRRSASAAMKKQQQQPPMMAAIRSMSTSTTSPYAHFEMAPTDPIVGLNELYQKDDYPQKVIVGVGSYRDGAGKPYVLPCVRKAEQILMDQNLDMEYAGIVSIF